MTGSRSAGVNLPRCAGRLARIATVIALSVSVTAIPGVLRAQSLLDRTPNTAGTWSLDRWSPLFAFAHRFELVAGGDEMFNVPTLQLAMGLPSPALVGITTGVDFSSNSESTQQRAGENETQWWMRVSLPALGVVRSSITGAYNTAARSVDGALGIALAHGPVLLIAEGRGFSDRFGTGDPGGAAAVGMSWSLTRYLALQGDIASAFTDGVGSAWSAGVAIAIPGSPHTLSLHATNSGPTTLQGSSREKILGPRNERYGFVFTVPLGGAERWRRIFAGAGDRRGGGVSGTESLDTNTVRVRLLDLEFEPRELRIAAGTTVQWRNDDPVLHTVAADDGSWESGFMRPDSTWSHRFTQPGRYSYHCEPHPQMRGVIIVE